MPLETRVFAPGYCIAPPSPYCLTPAAPLLSPFEPTRISTGDDNDRREACFMKATICVAAMTFVIGSAIAQQGSNPQTPQSPAGANPQTTPQSSPSQTKDMQSGKETMNASGKESGSMNEMKTKTFKGTLVDAS